jgi:hypothetical protein
MAFWVKHFEAKEIIEQEISEHYKMKCLSVWVPCHYDVEFPQIVCREIASGCAE